MSLSREEIETIFGSKLRSCQKKSLDVVFEYLNKPYAKRSCLISLPTGAGKSGVITALSHYSKFNRILILSNRRAVCDQLIRQLNGEFFEKIGLEGVGLKKVFKNVEASDEFGIYVSTFQKLQSMNKDNLEELSALQDNIDLLIIDEGHSEPAPAWSELVRKIEAHKIIVTATPYRNDLFQFDLDPKNYCIYTFSQALSDDILEEPDFSVVEKSGILKNVREFIKKSPNLKCIVKCKTFEDVKEFVELFSGEFDILGVHEQYKNYSVENLKTSVPKGVSGSKYQIIVHQMKLDEGVDIPEAKLLVLTYPVSSGRELVQTVGRVVRKYEDEKAFVIELGNDSNHRMWKNYLEFDDYLRTGAEKFLRSLDTSGLVDSYLEAFPDMSYFGSSYKKKFDFKKFDASKSLNIPLASVCFVKKNDGFTIEAFLDTVEWELERTGTLTSQPENELDLNVLFSVSFNNSKLLKDQLFFEPKLEVLIVKDLKGYIAVLDTRGKDYSFESSLKLGASIDVDKLLKLGARSESTRTKEAHTRSISTSIYRAEGVSLKGEELEKTTTSQGNSSYALTTLKLDNLNSDKKKHSSYYLGLGSGRVSDQKKRNYSLQEINDWISDVRDVLESSLHLESQFISSYAQSVKEEPIEPPVNVLVDFTASDYDLHVVSGDHEGTLENNYLLFECSGNVVDFFEGAPISITLVYASKEGRLFFESDFEIKYADTYENAKKETARKFIDLLNNMPIKVFYEDGLIYSDGNFYRVSLPSDVSSDFENSKISGRIKSLSELSAADMSEKDLDNMSPDGFGPKSIFNLIDQLKNVSDQTLSPADLGPFYIDIPDLDFIWCTDMGTEPADFILSSPSKLIFVHVKCGKTVNPQSSAGSIAEVGGQSIKNLAHLISQNEDLLPGNQGNLDHNWPSSTAMQSIERVRLFNGKRFDNPNNDQGIRAEMKTNAFELVKKRRKSFAVKKELWIVVGNAFSRGDFVNQISKGSAGRGESLQAYQLIDSWISTAANMDVDFKMFVSP